MCVCVCELILCRNSLVEEMVFTLGRNKTQVRPLTQGKGTRELNLQMSQDPTGIRPRKMWFRTTTGPNTQDKDQGNTGRTAGPAPHRGAKDLLSMDTKY